MQEGFEGLPEWVCQNPVSKFPSLVNTINIHQVAAEGSSIIFCLRNLH